MEIAFSKYHGTGNDFIMIDDRESIFDVNNTKLIAQLCHRRFGIGADGLILLRDSGVSDFDMVYFNADGRQSSMCGNGGRCLVHFAHSLGVFADSCTFLAIDGLHEAEINADGIVKLKMGDVNQIENRGDDYILNTGSPHYVCKVDDVQKIDVKSKGASIRYSSDFKKEGINVNFIQWDNYILHVATYERGVEDETYSCGTGVTAASLVAHELFQVSSPVTIHTKGGPLKVYFEIKDTTYNNVWLEGPAEKIYTGISNNYSM